MVQAEAEDAGVAADATGTEALVRQAGRDTVVAAVEGVAGTGGIVCGKDTER